MLYTVYVYIYLMKPVGCLISIDAHPCTNDSDCCSNWSLSYYPY